MLTRTQPRPGPQAAAAETLAWSPAAPVIGGVVETTGAIAQPRQIPHPAALDLTRRPRARQGRREAVRHRHCSCASCTSTSMAETRSDLIALRAPRLQPLGLQGDWGTRKGDCGAPVSHYQSYSCFHRRTGIAGGGFKASHAVGVIRQPAALFQPARKLAAHQTQLDDPERPRRGSAFATPAGQRGSGGPVPVCGR